MADTKISALAAVTDVIGTDEYVLARSGATKKIDASDLAAGLAGLAVIDHTEITSNVSVNAGTTEVTVITSSSFTADGTSAYLIEFYSPLCTAFDGSTTMQLHLREDPAGANTYRGLIGQVLGASQTPVLVVRRLTPSAASHTYRVTASRTTGSQTPQVNAGDGTAGNYAPAFIRITKE